MLQKIVFHCHRVIIWMLDNWLQSPQSMKPKIQSMVKWKATCKENQFLHHFGIYFYEHDEQGMNFKHAFYKVQTQAHLECSPIAAYSSPVLPCINCTK